LSKVVTYRPAKHEDFLEISNLIRTSFLDLLKQYGFGDSSAFSASRLPPPTTGPFPWYELGLKEDPDGFWVADAGDKLVGFTLSWVRGSLWYLAHLFILPEYQGQNIGRNLMDRAFQYRCMHVMGFIPENPCTIWNALLKKSEARMFRRIWS
jgi:ribosomal protein S18 acetylase RimI-like enzyme